MESLYEQLVPPEDQHSVDPLALLEILSLSSRAEAERSSSEERLDNQVVPLLRSLDQAGYRQSFRTSGAGNRPVLFGGVPDV